MSLTNLVEMFKNKPKTNKFLSQNERIHTQSTAPFFLKSLMYYQESKLGTILQIYSGIETFTEL